MASSKGYLELPYEGAKEMLLVESVDKVEMKVSTACVALRMRTAFASRMTRVLSKIN